VFQSLRGSPPSVMARRRSVLRPIADERDLAGVRSPYPAGGGAGGGM